MVPPIVSFAPAIGTKIFEACTTKQDMRLDIEAFTNQLFRGFHDLGLSISGAGLGWAGLG